MSRLDGSGIAGSTRLMIAVTVGAIVVGALTAPGWIASVTHRASSAPAFPTEIAPYAWWTPPLAAGDAGTAVMLYQNGFGVEFLDNPQAVLLGSDGSTYRRHSVAEARAGAADQGDPADSVLSPDGATVVTAGLDGAGAVTVTTVATGATVEVPVGDGLDVIPVSIDAAGSVLLLLSEGPLSPYLDREFRLHGRLARLDATSGEITEYRGFTDVASAALSPDGERIAVFSVEGVQVADADGSNTTDVPGVGTDVHLDGDAWSPDGSRFAFFGGDGLTIVDVSPEDPVVTSTVVGGEIEASAVAGSVIGWRDGETVLLHSSDLSGSNESTFSWVNAITGRMDTFSTYTPDMTGAALGGPDVARDLVPSLEVRALPVDRGGAPIVLVLATGFAAAFLVWWVTPPLASAPVHGRRVHVSEEPRRRVAHDQAGLQLDPRG